MRELPLRYSLLIALEPPGSVRRVSELVEHLHALRIDLGPLPSKFVSNLLRAERSRGRVERVAWGKYRFGYVPRTTRYRAKIVAEDLAAAAEHMREAKSHKEAEQDNKVEWPAPSYSWPHLMGHASNQGG
jgi:DNA-binding HxlR family transcriptional regulator